MRKGIAVFSLWRRRTGIFYMAVEETGCVKVQSAFICSYRRQNDVGLAAGREAAYFQFVKARNYFLCYYNGIYALLKRPGICCSYFSCTAIGATCCIQRVGFRKTQE